MLIPLLLAAMTVVGPESVHAVPIAPAPASATAFPPLAGRESDDRVARIAFRLAMAGVRLCPKPQPVTGLVLEHLSQFRAEDRPGILTALALDRGPAIIVVVPDSPAAIAGVRPRDVLLQIDGVPLPSDTALDATFDPAASHARADAVEDLLVRAGTRAVTLSLLRDDQPVTVRMMPVPACPSHVVLARSSQHNAYADGRHVLLTTGLVALVRNEDELAFIIAHEMAHNILGHAAIMRSGAVGHGLGRTLGMSGSIIRDTERQADRLGGELMLDAGYDPVAGAGILHRLGGTDLGIALFATHDSAAKRIAAMRALAADHIRS